jgi:prepilin-type N-terminal cleavage/methylation domain-containing protein
MSRQPVGNPTLFDRSPGPRPVRRRHVEQSEAGFTLIELLVVVVIMPLIIGAISVALLAVFQQQGTVSGTLTSAGDAQTVSANFVQDVQSAQWITTTSAGQCGAGTVVLSLSSDSASLSSPANVTSYVLNGSTGTMFRNVCTASGESSAAVSHNTPAGPAVTIQPGLAQTQAGGGWALTTGASTYPATTNVQLTLSEPPANYAFNLSAVPRVVAVPNSGPGSSTAPGSSQSPLFPLEVLGTSASCPPNPPDLTIAGGATVQVGSAPNWNGGMGVASNCSGSISMAGSGHLSSSIFTGNPSGTSVSASGGAVYPSTETYTTGLTNPFASLAAPSNPSLSGLATGSCSGSGPYTCTPGLYANSPSFSNTGVVTFDPSTGPDVFVFNQPVSIHNSQVINFEGGSPVSQVVYWFRGGLSISGAANVTFGPATYIFGDSSANQSAVTTLSVGNGATVNSNNDQGVLWYVENGLASFTGAVSTPIEGDSLYDNIAIWDASSYPLTLSNGSTITAQFGGIYDSSQSCTSAGSPVACVQFTGNNALQAQFVTAYTLSLPSGSPTLTVTG